MDFWWESLSYFLELISRNAKGSEASGDPGRPAPCSETPVPQACSRRPSARCGPGPSVPSQVGLSRQKGVPCARLSGEGLFQKPEPEGQRGGWRSPW